MELRRRLKTPRLWLAITFLGLVLVCCCTPARALFDEQFLIQQLPRWGHWAICLFVVIYTLATVLGFPGTIITIAGSIIFGLAWGTFWSVVGATLGALGAFYLARYLLRNWALRRFGNHKALVRFNQAVNDKPLALLSLLSVLPVWAKKR